jgi:hypothetical protein
VATPIRAGVGCAPLGGIQRGVVGIWRWGGHTFGGEKMIMCYQGRVIADSIEEAEAQVQSRYGHLSRITILANPMFPRWYEFYAVVKSS